MEIGDEAVQNLELVAGVDEYAGPAALRLQHAVLIRSGFHGAAAGGADADNAAAVLLCLIDNIRRLLGHDVELGMHVMILNGIHLDRAEGAETDMQGDMGDSNAHRLYFRQEFFGKMQACGGCSRRALMLGINRLIAVLILQLMGDVGRKGHLAQLVQNLLENTLIMELDEPVSFFYHVQHGAGEKSVAELNHRARLAFLSGFHQGLPDIILLAGQEKHFDFGAGVGLCADQPGRNYLGIIDDQAVPGLQIFLDIPEGPVFHFAGILVQNHQSGGSAVLQRILRNQFLGQVIIKIFYIHEKCLSVLSFTCLSIIHYFFINIYGKFSGNSMDFFRRLYYYSFVSIICGRNAKACSEYGVLQELEILWKIFSHAWNLRATAIKSVLY